MVAGGKDAARLAEGQPRRFWLSKSGIGVSQTVPGIPLRASDLIGRQTDNVLAKRARLVQARVLRKRERQLTSAVLGIERIGCRFDGEQSCAIVGIERIEQRDARFFRCDAETKIVCLATQHSLMEPGIRDKRAVVRGLAEPLCIFEQRDAGQRIFETTQQGQTKSQPSALAGGATIVLEQPKRRLETLGRCPPGEGALGPFARANQPLRGAAITGLT